MTHKVAEDDCVILIVDDSPVDQQLLSACLAPQGYHIDLAADGVDAMTMLEADPTRYDVVLLDRSMPRMNGMEVLGAIKSSPRLRMLPVIIQTAATERDQILDGIRAGAYYYLTKPYDRETVVTIVDTAAGDFAEYKRLRAQVARGLGCLTLIQSATLSIRTIREARDTAIVLANACPDPAVVVIGLTELLVNAVEHGNLGITYEDKTQLNASGDWEAEVERRLALPENAAKRVEIRLDRNGSELRFTIRDDGPGFPWKEYLDIDPRRAFDNHGRGIAISRVMSFDRVEYSGSGNTVTASVKLPASPSAS
jgi:CheY-like chemotaxis protein